MEHPQQCLLWSVEESQIEFPDRYKKKNVNKEGEKEWTIGAVCLTISIWWWRTSSTVISVDWWPPHRHQIAIIHNPLASILILLFTDRNVVICYRSLFLRLDIHLYKSLSLNIYVAPVGNYSQFITIIADFNNWFQLFCNCVAVYHIHREPHIMSFATWSFLSCFRYFKL